MNNSSEEGNKGQQQSNNQDVGLNTPGLNTSTFKQEELFLQAVEVAYAAHTARQQATEAGERAAYITSLAQKAKSEADALSHVANTIATTAKSVASLALGICQYRSFEDAYGPQHHARLPFAKFMEVINRPPMDAQQLQPDSRPSWGSSQLLTTDLHNAQPLPIFSNTSSSNTRYVESVRSDQRSSAFQESGAYRNRSLPLSADTGSRPPRPPPPEYRPTSYRPSGSQHEDSSTPVYGLKKGPRYRPVQDLQVSDSSSEKFLERYPSPVNALDYKDSLAASFENTESTMHPLWEDQYVHVHNGTGGRPKSAGPSGRSPMGTSDKWADRKYMKQFQIRLHKADPDEEHKHSTSGAGRRSQDSASSVESSYQDGGCNCDHWHCVHMRSNTMGRSLGREVQLSESELTDDGEVEDIFDNEPQMLKMVKDLSTKINTAGRVSPSIKPKLRSVSPLLEPSEQEKYTVIGEFDNLHGPTQKHIFQPLNEADGQQPPDHDTDKYDQRHTHS